MCVCVLQYRSNISSSFINRSVGRYSVTGAVIMMLENRFVFVCFVSVCETSNLDGGVVFTMLLQFRVDSRHIRLFWFVGLGHCSVQFVVILAKDTNEFHFFWIYHCYPWKRILTTDLDGIVHGSIFTGWVGLGWVGYNYVCLCRK